MSTARPAAVVVLAAGSGTRMRSATPKVLHEIGGLSLLGHALAAAAGTAPEHLVVVVRHDRDAVAAHALGRAPGAVVADQDEVPGTGSAVRAGLAALAASGVSLAPDATVLVTYGDVPLLTAQTLARLVGAHQASTDAVTVLTADLEDPTGYGRVVREAGADSSGGAGGGHGGAVVAVVEQRDATPAQRAITEVNSGVYAFDAGVLADALPRLGRDNAAGEAYLTDVVALARADGRTVAALRTDDVWQTEGVNDRVQLSRLHAEANRRTVAAHQLAGVTVVDPATTWVDATVVLDADVTLLPGTQLHGQTCVAAGARVGPDTTLTDVVVGAGASVLRTHATGARIGAGASVGPFSYLRPGTDLGAGGKVGAYVEVKGSSIGPGAKVPHLSYVGDAQIGAGANVGAGTIVANYDGVAKHRTVVGDHAFVGSDSVLVAPLTIGDGAYTGAGSTIVDDVPPGAMGVARGRQRTVAGWTARRRPGTASARAADAASAAAPPAHAPSAAPDPVPEETGATP